jgi:hypothetical protein
VSNLMLVIVRRSTLLSTMATASHSEIARRSGLDHLVESSVEQAFANYGVGRFEARLGSDNCPPGFTPPSIVGCKAFDAAQAPLVGIALMPISKQRQLGVAEGNAGRMAAAPCSASAALSPPQTGAAAAS